MFMNRIAIVSDIHGKRPARGAADGLESEIGAPLAGLP